VPTEFRTEHVQAKPAGWRARTIVTHTGHEIRIGFPPGPRKRGSGRVLEILHPHGENPSCEVTPRRAVELANRELSNGGKNPAELVIFGLPNPGDLPETEKAADLYEEFHGEAPKETLDVQRSARIRTDYTGLGALDTLVVADGFSQQEFARFREEMGRENGNLGRVHKPANTGIISFSASDKVTLASNAGGTQLYLIGGNQDLTPCLLELGADPSKDQVDLGFCICVRYIAEKAHVNHGPALYWHILGEESNRPPRLAYDKLKREIFFTGGEYVVKAPGIIN
jgi:hypothetical protein